MLRTIQQIEDEHNLARHYTMKLRDPKRLKALQMRLGLSSNDMELIEQVIKDDSDIVPNEFADHEHIEI
ncbi:hypothetical protein [Staphylococcus arlettae]|uniref:hypothetical protein n=1 Tax=Staphylococcus arlettae TaxID=29378 RepID=UPI0021CF801C|nr:hypothetical protein [Staphylococcus arlettae]UXU53195.1 hypothetical protein MUA71_03715 [Staphylococcus arlettae]